MPWGGGAMSNARGADKALKEVNNIVLKGMIPLMRISNALFLADEDKGEAPSVKAVFDMCMASMTLLCEANLQIENLRWAAFKPTTPSIYK